jgi:hypothetical protein
VKDQKPDLTPEERRAIKGALRRAFRQSPRMREVLQRARVELPPALKKDGTPGKKNQVRYACAVCEGLFPQKFVQVDHKNPAVPLDVKEEDMSMDDMVSGIFCSQSNLQVLCSTPIKSLPKGSKKSCHALKTAEENFIRRGIAQSGGSVESWRLQYDSYVRLKEAEKEAKARRKIEKQQKKLSKKETP